MQEHIFGNLKVLQSILIEQGTGFLMLCFLAVAFTFIALFNKFAKNSKWFIKLKNKLMWSSVFRSVIQTYLPTCLTVFTLIKISIQTESLDVIKSMSSLIKFSLVLFIPVFSLVYLKRQQHKLQDDH
jgi:amino acid transporter